MELQTKYGIVKIFAQTIEQEAIGQITVFANSLLGENAHIRIMPDAHAGAGCVVGTTMRITDKVCPNLVGVDIGCGVTLAKTDGDFRGKLDRIDTVIREKVPSGMRSHDRPVKEAAMLEQMRCFSSLDKRAQNLAYHALGTLGGGNHFIEVYDEGYIAVHTGSRNIGLRVAGYYQDKAVQNVTEILRTLEREAVLRCPPQEREAYIKANKGKVSVQKDLAYLTGQDMEDYLFDMRVLQQFAAMNRQAILDTITKNMKVRITDVIHSVHNYIDVDNRILRKGAISAQAGEKLVIPMNMRDGILLCEGKGNEDWNESAPHGAGRLYSRGAARKSFTVSQYKKAMQGIFSTCISAETLDEAPFVYKNYEEIIQAVEPSVTVLRRITPLYNFKAGSEK